MSEYIAIVIVVSFMARILWYNSKWTANWGGFSLKRTPLVPEANLEG